MINILYVLLSALVLGLDRLGKRESREHYSDGKKRTFGKGHAAVTMQHVCNYGAVLNFLDHRRWLVRLLSIVLTIVLTILYIFTLGHAGKGLLKAGLSLLLGGAYSNTYDRLHDGYVTDYLSFHFGTKRFRNIVFNIGDFAIIIGALLIVLGS